MPHYVTQRYAIQKIHILLFIPESGMPNYKYAIPDHSNTGSVRILSNCETSIAESGHYNTLARCRESGPFYQAWLWPGNISANTNILEGSFLQSAKIRSIFVDTFWVKSDSSCRPHFKPPLPCAVHALRPRRQYMLYTTSSSYN